MIIPHLSSISVFAPAYVAERLRSGNPLLPNLPEQFDATIIRLHLVGLASLAGEQFPASIERLPLVEEFYQNILRPYLATSGIVLELNAHYMTVIFPLEGKTQSLTIRSALIATENALQLAKRWHEANQRILKQAIHIQAVVAVGSVNLMSMQHESEWQAFLYGGNIFAQVEKSFAFTKPWEMLAHSDLLKKLGKLPEGEWRTSELYFAKHSYQDTATEIPEGGFLSLVDMQENPDQRLETFVLPQLRQYLQTHNARMERNKPPNPTACVILKLDTLSFVEDIDLDRWQRILHQIYLLTYRYGGYIDFGKLDATYSRLYIYFGVLDMEDDAARRAVSCTNALLKSLAELEPKARAAIAGAAGLAALVGSQEQRFFVTISEAIARAEQLIDHVHSGEILADDTIIEQAGDHFRWNRRLLADETHRLNSLPLRRQPDTLYGRTEELTALDQVIADGLAGVNHLLVISGAGGTGKSALIDVLVQKWQAAGGQGYMSTGSPFNPPAPYQLWLPIWRALLGLNTYEAPALAKRYLTDWFARNLPQHPLGAMFFQNLLGVEQQEPVELHMLEAPTRQKIIFDVLIAMLEQAAAQAPLLLTFESLARMDTNSLDLLQQLPMRLGGLPILICLESAGKDTWLNGLEDAQAIDLDYWNRAEAIAYLKQRFAGQAWDWSAAPLEEYCAPADITLLATLMEDRTNIAPPALSQVHSLFFDQLSTAEKAILAECALWGAEFPARAAWLKSTSPGKAALLDKLRRYGVIERSWDTNEALVWDRFRRSVFRDEALAWRTPHIKLAAYQEIAQFLQTYWRGAARAARLAQVVDAHSQPISLAQWHIMAGDHARRWGAEKEALDHYFAAEKVLEEFASAEEGTAPRIMLLLGRASLYQRQHATAQGMEDAKLAYELATSENDSFSMIRAMILQAEFHQLKQEYTAAAEITDRVVYLAEMSQFHEMIAHGMWIKANSLHHLGRLAESARIFQKITPYAQRYNTPAMQVSIALDAVTIHLENHRRDFAREQIDLAIALGRELGDPGLLQRVWAGYGHVRLLFGEAQNASEAFENALSLTSPEGMNLTFLADILRDYGVAQCYLGQYADAESMFITAEAYFEQIADVPGRLQVSVLRAGELMFDQGLYDDALSILNDALASKQLEYSPALYAELVKAAIYTRQGKADKARQMLNDFQQNTEGNAWQWYRPLWHLRMGEVALADEQYKIAMHHAYSGLGSVGTQSDLRYLTPTYCLLAVCLYLSSGASDSVYDALHRAIKTGRSQARRLHLAQSLQLTGKYVRQSSTRQTVRARSGGYLFEASYIFDELGLSPSPMWESLPEALV